MSRRVKNTCSMKSTMMCACGSSRIRLFPTKRYSSSSGSFGSPLSTCGGTVESGTVVRIAAVHLQLHRLGVFLVQNLLLHLRAVRVRGRPVAGARANDSLHRRGEDVAAVWPSVAILLNQLAERALVRVHLLGCRPCPAASAASAPASCAARRTRSTRFMKSAMVAASGLTFGVWPEQRPTQPTTTVSERRGEAVECDAEAVIAERDATADAARQPQPAIVAELQRARRNRARAAAASLPAARLWTAMIHAPGRPE